MQRRQTALWLHHAVQQAAALERVRRYVLVGLLDDRKAREHRVAVVPMPGDRVATVGDLAPDLVRDEFVLRFQRPVAISARVPAVHALHFLEEHHVGIQPMQLVAHFVDDDPPCQVGKSLVNVVGSDGKTHGGGVARGSSYGNGNLPRPWPAAAKGGAGILPMVEAVPGIYRRVQSCKVAYVGATNAMDGRLSATHRFFGHCTGDGHEAAIDDSSRHREPVCARPCGLGVGAAGRRRSPARTSATASPRPARTTAPPASTPAPVKARR